MRQSLRPKLTGCYRVAPHCECVCEHAVHVPHRAPPAGRIVTLCVCVEDFAGELLDHARGVAVGLLAGWFWIFTAYSSQYNGTDADFSATGGMGWFFGVMPVLFVGAVYHLALLPLGFMAYRANGLLLALIAAGVSAGLYASLIIPAAIASGGPESFVP